MPREPVIAIVGATGAVGVEFLELIEQRGLRFCELRLLASARSAGTTMRCGDRSFAVAEATPDAFDGVDIALFSAGKGVSQALAPAAVRAGAWVIDNSSAFRMVDGVPLVVPEANGDEVDALSDPCIIANPNCSTIIALVAVTPLHRAVPIERMVVSTYQAASGAGAAAMRELEGQAREFVDGREYTTSVFGRQYLFNVFSHNSAVGADGYNEEERKLLLETQKIWRDASVRVTATCVRVPVLRAHCEAINLTFAGDMPESRVRALLATAPGVRVVDDRKANRFPEPIDAAGQDDVLVGRIRQDWSQDGERGVDLFVAGDQIRKGAALNAIQIAERLLTAGKLSRTLAR